MSAPQAGERPEGVAAGGLARCGFLNEIGLVFQLRAPASELRRCVSRTTLNGITTRSPNPDSAAVTKFITYSPLRYTLRERKPWSQEEAGAATAHRVR